MKFTKLIKADFERTPEDLAELNSNEHLRNFETKVWSAFNQLEDDLVIEFKLDSIRPFMEKTLDELQAYVESLDPKIKAEIAKQLEERQNRYK